MELATFVALGLPFRVLALACAKLAEVLCRPGSRVGKELHFNPPKWFTWSRLISMYGLTLADEAGEMNA